MISFANADNTAIQQATTQVRMNNDARLQQSTPPKQPLRLQRSELQGSDEEMHVELIKARWLATSLD